LKSRQTLIEDLTVQSSLDEKNTMGIRLYVGNLPLNVTEEEVRAHFSVIGPLSYLSIPTDRETGRQRGFAFVEFKDRAQADEAIRRFNNQLFKGRSLSVSEARARTEGPRPAPARPALSRPASTATSRPASTAGAEPGESAGNKPSRNLGPDKPSRHGRGRPKGEFKADRGPKGPMREIVRGRFFGDLDDDDADYLDDDADYDEEGNEDNFETGVSDSEKDA
jgi:cold-inducible RNA-binding protein